MTTVDAVVIVTIRQRRTAAVGVEVAALTHRGAGAGPPIVIPAIQTTGSSGLEVEALKLPTESAHVTARLYQCPPGPPQFNLPVLGVQTHRRNTNSSAV